MASFQAPDPNRVVHRLPLRDPRKLSDVHRLPFSEIVDYLDELGRHLVLDSNAHLQQALEHSAQWSDMTIPLVRASFQQLPALFDADAVRQLAEATIGVPHLAGWVERTMADGRTVSIRAMGARTLHIIAGNSPIIAALSIVRNAVARSDAVVKTPSNDPLTALAIARTMAEMAPDHPITRHLSVVYWKGGDTEVETALCQPANIEKIIAWGGFASVTHVLRYVQPGLELITLDPKRSATIIGPEAFASEQSVQEVALRLATDIGALNQLGCVNARVVYVASGLAPDGLDRLNTLGEAVYQQLQRLPEMLSTPAKTFDPELRGSMDALRASPEWYRVYGGRDGEGAVICSQLDEPVDFHRSLSGRVANLVPIEDPLDAVAYVNAYTQTIGIYPESLKATLRDVLALHGAQRLVSLGYAADPDVTLPQDGLEPMRRMVKWIVDEQCDPETVTPLWVSHSNSAERRPV
ncbi:acyl-CoA reductase [Mycobacterium sp. pUA109]|uniref:acyl-CoA reductase n=1 Tax=Mycobacterium sp. pUA109 TaxID=3238982 RepID=UPI00351AE12A